MSPPYLPLPQTKHIADSNPERLRAVVALTKSLYPSALIVPHVTEGAKPKLPPPPINRRTPWN